MKLLLVRGKAYRTTLPWQKDKNIVIKQSETHIGLDLTQDVCRLSRGLQVKNGLQSPLGDGGQNQYRPKCGYCNGCSTEWSSGNIVFFYIL